MRVSVIVPVYNAERWLEACIDSILAQTFTDFELLLVNDGSCDGSGDICRRYASLDGRIRFFDTPNRGVSAARNLALDNARGEYVVFVDADDYVLPDHLALLSARAADDTMVVCNFSEQRGDRTIAAPMRDCCVEGREASLAVFAEQFRYRWLNLVWNKIFSRAVIERHGLRFNEGLCYGEDTVFAIEYGARMDNISIDSRPTYIYRFVSGSASHRQIGLPQLTAGRNAALEAFSALGCGDECLYLTNRLYWSRFRRELRNERSAETAELLVREIVSAVQGMKSYRRLRFMRRFYDWTTWVTSGLVTLSKSPSWVKFAVKTLHL